MEGKQEYKCPYCGSKIRVNTKAYPRGEGRKQKQAQCTNWQDCEAKGPLTVTLEEAKEAFCGSNTTTQQST